MMSAQPRETSFNEFLTDAELQKLLRVSNRTTQRWRDDGTGPRFIRIGRQKVLYSRAEVDDWLARQTHKHRAAEAVAAA